VKKVLGGKFSMLATGPLLATLRHQVCHWHLDFLEYLVLTHHSTTRTNQ